MIMRKGGMIPMKNFSKLLALSVALSLIFGMTAFADEEMNPSVSTKYPGIDDNVLYEMSYEIDGAKGNEAISVAPVSVADYDLVADLAKDKSFANSIADTLDAEEVTKVELVSTFDIMNKTGEITLYGLENKVDASAKYVMYHEFADRTWELLPVTVNSDKSITFTTGSNSLFALYKVDATAKDTGSDDGDDDNDTPAVTADGAPASPKTGETLPVAGIAMMIALAGAAVCAKKVRYNN